MKTERHTKIIELINKHDILTQDELAEYLNEEGYNVTQATVSRDIRELKLTKMPDELGRQKYVFLENRSSDLNEKYIRILQDAFVSMAMAQNILVIKTDSGMAMAVAAALDAIKFSEIVGCVGGDDTIMCAVRSLEETYVVMEKIRKIVSR
jgi:transcriptional regulator of arginine metabolism